MKEKTNPSHAKEFNNAIIFFDKYSRADKNQTYYMQFDYENNHWNIKDNNNNKL